MSCLSREQNPKIWDVLFFLNLVVYEKHYNYGSRSQPHCNIVVSDGQDLVIMCSNPNVAFQKKKKKLLEMLREKFLYLANPFYTPIQQKNALLTV